jgi:hypothetical protein
MTRRSPTTGGRLERAKPGSLRIFQDHSRALAQRQTCARILLEGSVKGGMTDHDEVGAGDDLLDVRVLRIPSFTLYLAGSRDAYRIDS